MSPMSLLTLSTDQLREGHVDDSFDCSHTRTFFVLGGIAATIASGLLALLLLH